MKLPHNCPSTNPVRSASLSACLLIMLSAGAVCEQNLSDPVGSIHGRPISEWPERIKGLDPNGPQAAAHVPVLIDLIRTESVPEFTRSQAAVTLGRIGKPAAAAVPVLVEILTHADSDSTRLWALKALSLLRETAGSASADVAAVVRNVNQTHLIRVAGLEALARIGPQQPQVMRTLLDGVRGHLESRNANSQRELRMASAEALGLLDEAASPALPELIRAAEADWDLLRLSAVTSIGRIGPQGEIAIPALADVILFDDAPEVRDAAARSLGNIGTASLPTLIQLARLDDRDVRESALLGAIALGQSGTPILFGLLGDTDTELRIRAAEQLLSHKTFSRQAANVLLADLATAPPRAQRTAYMALRRHPSTWSTSDRGFQDLLQHTNPRLQQLAHRLQGERPSEGEE